MMIDGKIHEVNGYLNEGIMWHDFSDVGLDEPYFSYYYAEDRLYLIKDNMTDCIWFIEEGSPAKALQVVKDRWDEAMKAGQPVEENYDDL
jgi:hypothetical protein